MSGPCVPTSLLQNFTKKKERKKGNKNPKRKGKTLLPTETIVLHVSPGCESEPGAGSADPRAPGVRDGGSDASCSGTRASVLGNGPVGVNFVLGGPGEAGRGFSVLGHPPGTSGPRTSVNTAKRGLLRAAHPTGGVRDVAAPRDPHTWRAQLRWGCLRRRPGPAACPSRKRSAADYRADLPGGADSRRPGRAFGGVGASGQPPAAANSSAQGWSLPGAREGPHWAPPEPTRDPRGGRRGQAGAPSPQTSARARAPPRVPSASGLRGGAAAGAPRGPGRPKRHRPQAPGRGVPEGAGPRAARPPRRGRRACGGGGAARGAQPIQGRGSKFHRPRSLRRPAPHSRALRAASPFRARYAAAILFTSLPLPAPPRTPHAWPQDTPPREDDVSTRWLNLQSPPPCPPHRR